MSHSISMCFFILTKSSTFSKSFSYNETTSFIAKRRWFILEWFAKAEIKYFATSSGDNGLPEDCVGSLA